MIGFVKQKVQLSELFDADQWPIEEPRRPPPPSLALLATMIAVQQRVATVLVTSGDSWHHVRDNARQGVPPDSGIVFDAGPHAWWIFVSASDLSDIVFLWGAQGFFTKAGLAAHPLMPLAPLSLN